MLTRKHFNMAADFIARNADTAEMAEFAISLVGMINDNHNFNRQRFRETAAPTLRTCPKCGTNSIEKEREGNNEICPACHYVLS